MRPYYSNTSSPEYDSIPASYQQPQDNFYASFAASSPAAQQQSYGYGYTYGQTPNYNAYVQAPEYDLSSPAPETGVPNFLLDYDQQPEAQDVAFYSPDMEQAPFAPLQIEAASSSPQPGYASLPVYQYENTLPEETPAQTSYDDTDVPASSSPPEAYGDMQLVRTTEDEDYSANQDDILPSSPANYYGDMADVDMSSPVTIRETPAFFYNWEQENTTAYDEEQGYSPRQVEEASTPQAAQTPEAAPSSRKGKSYRTVNPENGLQSTAPDAIPYATYYSRKLIAEESGGSSATGAAADTNLISYSKHRERQKVHKTTGHTSEGANSISRSAYRQRQMVDPETGAPSNAPNAISKSTYTHKQLVDPLTGKPSNAADAITRNKYNKTKKVDPITGQPSTAADAISRDTYNQKKRRAARKK